MIKIAVLWCNHYPGTATHDNFLAVNQFLIDNLFTLPSYYKIDGKPAVFIFQSGVLLDDLGGSANIASAITEAKAMAVNAGLGGISFVGEWNYGPSITAQQMADEGYTGYTQYTWPLVWGRIPPDTRLSCGRQPVGRPARGMGMGTTMMGEPPIVSKQTLILFKNYIQTPS